MPRSEWFTYALSIGVSSFLLFSIQPIVAKGLLPHYGGSAAVWITCMLFFQCVLVLGYLYSFWVTRYLSRRTQVTVHLSLLLASVVALGLLPYSAGQPAYPAHPVLSILDTLAVSVGLPYFMLSTNGPLLQSWYAASPGAAFPYRLFAWSNAASLLALLAYPVAIEPLLPVAGQLRVWSDVFIGMGVLVAGVALRSRATPVRKAGFTVPGWRGPLLWVALAACGCTLWLAVANHLSQEVAAIPFLWVLPLSAYLLSCIVCFERDGWYSRRLFRWLLPAACVAVCYRLAVPSSTGGLVWDIAIFLAALFVCCMFCHGELAHSRPDDPGELAFFYLMLASGGALGGVFVGAAAPALFNSYLELPVAVTASVLLGFALLYGFPPRRLVRVGLMAVLALAAATELRMTGRDVFHARNFYGVVQVSDIESGVAAIRSLYNGNTIHGREFLAPDRSRIATAFYGEKSGAGQVLRAAGPSPRRVGVVGLGAGTLAAYGRPGDLFRFYEINPAVAEAAQRQFRFLAESAAKTEVTVADGRLALEREPDASFDVLVLDAFSDDTIPAHLLTREAFEIYFRRLRPSGILLVHVTNRYLELGSVVKAAAGSLGKTVILVRNAEDTALQVLPSDWAVIPNSGQLALPLSSVPGIHTREIRPWTDSYSNLFSVLM